MSTNIQWENMQIEATTYTCEHVHVQRTRMAMRNNVFQAKQRTTKKTNQCYGNITCIWTCQKIKSPFTIVKIFQIFRTSNATQTCDLSNNQLLKLEQMANLRPIADLQNQQDSFSHLLIFLHSSRKWNLWPLLQLTTRLALLSITACKLLKRKTQQQTV